MPVMQGLGKLRVEILAGEMAPWSGEAGGARVSSVQASEVESEAGLYSRL